MFNAGRRGQGMTEYIIIVALVAIALIVIVAVFGSNIKALFQGANTTFKDGREFKEMKDSGSYDDSADSGKHKTGKMEGE
ncbi:MAG: hypothetical protein AABZ60_00755 [Planctomycetota bacterium]